VEQGGTVEIFGDVLYNTGEPVVNAEVNITIMNEPGNWLTNTDSNGFYSEEITITLEPALYWVEVEASKSGFEGSAQERLTVQEPASQPDLEISSSDIQFSKSDPYAGETIRISVIVRNNGDGDATNVVVNGYYGDPDGSGKPISPDSFQTVGTILSGDQGFVELNWDTSGILGTQDVYIKLDPGDSIAESDETNNKAFNSITILGRPDFAVEEDDITFTGTDPMVGDEISIIIIIRNLGSESGTVKYEVYDGDPEAGGVEIDSGEEILTDDEETTLLIPWIPQEAGEHEIFVVLEPKGNVEEDDDSNNKASNTVTIGKTTESDDGVSPFIYLIIVIVVIVVLILFILNRRKQEGDKQLDELPMATVVKRTTVSVPSEDEDKTLMEGQGGIRL
jgi:subtilase family serine protease